MTPLASANGADVHCCDWRSLLDVVPTCDALIVDAPYSADVHAGHDRAAGEEGKLWHHDGIIEPMVPRRSIAYAAWTPSDVREFVELWHPRVKGWFCTITDHVLARSWEAQLERMGRYVFAPLPFVAPGSRVRLAGDGPSCWTTWIIVARPRSREWATWGTLPGAYVLPEGQGGAMPVVGGKPLWLAERLVSDYSRPDDLCVDPCCGAGTLAVAAIRTGRRAIVGDVDESRARLAAEWIKNPSRPAPDLDAPTPNGTMSLFR